MRKETVLPYKLGITEEEITPNGGLVIFGEFILSIGLDKKVEKIFPEPGSGRGFRAWEYIFPLLLMIHSGGRHLEDTRKIAEDKGLRKVLGIKRVPSPDAIGGWLRRQGSDGAKLMEILNRDIARWSMKREERSEYTLDMDTTLTEGDKKDAYYTYKGFKGYAPILGHLEENRLILSYEFREGNESPSSRIVEFYKRCKSEMAEGKTIKNLRADSASYQSGLIDEAEGDGARYAIGGRMDDAVKEVIKAIRKDKYREYGNAFISETVHIMNKSKNPFRLVVLKRPAQGSLFEKEESKYFVVASNREESAEETLEFYHQRGEHSENRIKEFKIDFGMERMPCGQFEANAMYFGIGVLAYNLYEMFINLALPLQFHRKRAITIRFNIYNVAARVVTTSRQIYLKVSKAFYELFENIRLKISLIRDG
jgi:hypothetical protein